jgi:hypothetical protein
VSQPYVPAAATSAYAERPQPASLADVLELVLDKGVIIAGDIKINLLEIELLTIKVRLLIASVDKAREMGITWWESDPSLTGPRLADNADGNGNGTDKELSQRVAALEQRLREVTGESGT